MRRFVDIRGMETGYAFAWWDTTTGAFEKHGGQMAWNRWQDFEEAYEGDKLKRYQAQIPKWATWFGNNEGGNPNTDIKHYDGLRHRLDEQNARIAKQQHLIHCDQARLNEFYMREDSLPQYLGAFTAISRFCPPRDVDHTNPQGMTKAAYYAILEFEAYADDAQRSRKDTETAK